MTVSSIKEHKSSSLKKLKEWLESNRISEVECIFPDIAGSSKGKILPVNRFVKSIYEKGHKIYAVGDDYENDIEFWLKNYNAQSYLIDNSNDEFIKNGEIFNTNILNAINHIFEK